MLKLNPLVVAKLFFDVPVPAEKFPMELTQIFLCASPHADARAPKSSSGGPNPATAAATLWGTTATP